MDYHQHYKVDAEVFDYFDAQALTPNERYRNAFLVRHCTAEAGDSILDIGSGRGWFSLKMAERGCKITAVDLSQNNLDKIKQTNPRIRCLYGSAESLPEDLISDNKPEQFDWIVLLEVLEHLVDPNLALHEVKKHLKPMGKLLIAVPFKENIIQELCIHCHQLTPHNAHLHSFDRQSLSALLCSNGYLVSKDYLYLHKLLSNPLFSWLSRLPYALRFFLETYLLKIISKKYHYLCVVAHQAKSHLL